MPSAQSRKAAAARTACVQQVVSSSIPIQESEDLRQVKIFQGTTSELLALVDLTRKDPDRLVGNMVAVKNALGIEARWLRWESGDYLLYPIGPEQSVIPLRLWGEWSIVGRVCWLRISMTAAPPMQDTGGVDAGSQLFGVYSRVARKLGVETSFVRRVARGLSRSKRVSSALDSEVRHAATAAAV